MSQEKPLWSGRFEGGRAESLRRIGDSLHVDQALVLEDLDASAAHARMLGRQGILSDRDAKLIAKGLERMSREIDSGRLVVEGDDEDVHSWIERTLTERIGPAGARLHTARSRNDQVATAFRLYVRGTCTNLVLGPLPRLMEALLAQAERTIEIIVPAYTHLQRGQPVLLAHHLLAYVEMLSRDRDRLLRCGDSIQECPLGSGAATGVPYPIDRDFTAEELGFEDGPSPNSMDAVSDRDFVVEFLAAASLLCVHLSRLAEDVCLWASSEWGLLELADAVSTGSSIMPQKRNPDGAELVRGKTGRVIGHLTGMLVTLKGLPMTYNRDLQEDKEAVLDAEHTLYLCLDAMRDTISESRFRPEAGARLLGRGHLLATELADFLVTQGVPFRQAHELVGQAVRRCDERGVDLSELDEAALVELDDRFRGAGEWLDVRRAVDRRDHFGGTATPRVRQAIEDWRAALASWAGEAAT